MRSLIPGKRLPKEQVADNVITAARDLVIEGGGDALQARAIAKRAGVSVGTVYNSYGDLVGLQLALHGQTLAKFQVAFEEVDATNVDAPTADRIAAFANAYIVFVSENQKLWEALVAFNAGRDLSELPSWYIDRVRYLLGYLDKELIKIDALEQNSELRQTVSRALYGAVNGILNAGLVGKLDNLLQETMLKQMRIIIDALVEKYDN